MASELENKSAAIVLEKLYLDTDLSDVDFVFEMDDIILKVPANKGILAVLSPVFNRMFFGMMKEKNEVIIKDAEPDAFKEFLQFFYLTKVTLTMENIEGVVRLADKYDIINSVSACAEFIQEKLTVQNLLWGYQLAIYMKNVELIRFCENKFRHSITEIIKSETFIRCDKKILERILTLDLPCDEIKIFHAILEWAKCACKRDGIDEKLSKNLKEQLGDCLKIIRFSGMKVEEFTETANKYDGLFTSDEFIDIVYMMTMKNYKPKIFTRKPLRIAWNKNKILKLMQDDTKTKKYIPGYMPSRATIEKSESVTITSNYPIILGEIYTGVIYDGSRGCQIIKIDISVTIKEINSRNLDYNTTESIIYEGDVEVCYEDPLKIILAQPIFIKKNTKYNISLQLSKNKNIYYDHNYGHERSNSNSESILKFENLEINLQADKLRSVRNSSSSRWIVGFGINQI